MFDTIKDLSKICKLSRSLAVTTRAKNRRDLNYREEQSSARTPYFRVPDFFSFVVEDRLKCNDQQNSLGHSQPLLMFTGI